jgi:hypothetical protein
MEIHLIGGTMIDLKNSFNAFDSQPLSAEMRYFLNETRSKLKGSERRKFMAGVVQMMGKGGQLRAERELGWDRKTIRKGLRELSSGIDCFDNYSGRGRNSIEQSLPNLLDDIKQIVSPVSQCDPTFCTTKLYSPLTAKEVRRRLIESGKYTDDQLPTIRTINTKLNQLGFRLKKVSKCKPKKKLQRQTQFSHMST